MTEPKRVGVAITAPDARGVRSEYGVYRLDPRSQTLSVRFEGTRRTEDDGTETLTGLPSGPWTSGACWWQQPFRDFVPARYEIVRFFEEVPGAAPTV